MSPVGKSSGGRIPMPTRKSATPFGTVSKRVYNRTSTGVTVQNHDVHRTAGDAYQPHNAPGAGKINPSVPRTKSGTPIPD